MFKFKYFTFNIVINYCLKLNGLHKILILSIYIDLTEAASLNLIINFDDSFTKSTIIETLV